MGMLSRGAELQVPARGRVVDGIGMGSMYGRRSCADMTLVGTRFIGLKCLAGSLCAGDAYE